MCWRLAHPPKDGWCIVQLSVPALALCKKPSFAITLVAASAVVGFHRRSAGSPPRQVPIVGPCQLPVDMPASPPRNSAVGEDPVAASELTGCHSKASGVDVHRAGGDDTGGSVMTVPLCPSLAEVN